MKKAKIIFSITLVLILCISAVFAVSAYDPRILYLGDADLDEKVNVKDATLIQKYTADLESLSDIQRFCADADESGEVNVKDATLIQKFVADMQVDHPVGEEIFFNDPTNPTDPTTASTAPTTEATEPSSSTTEPTTATTAPTEPTTLPTEPEDKMDTKITIYFSNNVKWNTVNAYLYNESEGTQNAQWPGKAMTLHSTNDYGEKIYKMDVDVSEYNRVVFNNGTSQTMNASLSVASSGFYITRQTPKSAMQLGVYAFEESDYGNLTTVNLDYPDNYKKPIYIWTPQGYDPADTSKEYKVIYLLDGQNQFLDSAPYEGGWGSDEIITALQHNGGEGIILVGIDNQRNRDKELTPDIGDVVPAYKNGFENGRGESFAKFVADTVVPYVQANYNVSVDPEDNAIIGSSSGGIEAFYIGMEYMDKFGNIGALSPAFMLFDKSDWDAYLDKFDFTEASKLPRIYFYNGGGDSLELELNPYAEAMPQWMEKLGYPESKMIFGFEEKNGHNEAAWRCVMPEIITWLFEL